MRKALFIFLAMMVYAMWAAAQSSPSPSAKKWRDKFTALPPGLTLATEAPLKGPRLATATWTPEPTYVPEMGPPSAWNNMPSPTMTPAPAASVEPSPTPIVTPAAPPLLPPWVQKASPTSAFTAVPDKGKKK